jgi:hypothetical protein
MMVYPALVLCRMAKDKAILTYRHCQGAWSYDLRVYDDGQERTLDTVAEKAVRELVAARLIMSLNFSLEDEAIPFTVTLTGIAAAARYKS